MHKRLITLVATSLAGCLPHPPPPPAPYHALGQDSACIGWARGLFDALTPYATGGVYVNFMPEDENDRVEKAYGTNYRRLAEIKRRYDPANLFRMNQNIRPA